MVSGTEIELDSIQANKFFPKRACESWITITHNGGWDSMQLENIFKKNLGHSRGCIGWLIGVKWPYFDNLSTTTNMVVLPLEVGNPSMKSIEMSVQIASGMGKGYNSPLG
jgi:hypothetical protein